MDIHGDRALPQDGIDRLGFKPMAERLAEALSLGVSTNGLVVGISGRWGSGKSSLLNLTQAALSVRDAASRPHVVEFRPWLVGDRDSLLRALFAELASGIDQIEQDTGIARSVALRSARKASKAVREFAARLGGVGEATKTAGLVVPWLGTIGAFIGGAANAASVKKTPSLSALKDQVASRLKQLPRSLVVIIDDVDRLEPREVVEVLRLVRSVADFPNVIYVLGYDLVKVAHAVEVAADVDDGAAYVEKIVQITVPVPLPEAFDLRHWFESEVKTLQNTATPDSERRVREIIDLEGGRYLTSPRAVIRTLDSVRFSWSAVKDQVDFGDFLWLQFVKVGNPALYDWIAVYLTAMAARSSGRVSISEEAITAARAKLDKALTEEDQTFSQISDRLSDFLPGIDVDFVGDSEKSNIYGSFDEISLQRSVQQRRLSSPDHYRVYLSFGAPANAPVHSDYLKLSSVLALSPEDSAQLLFEWNASRLTSGVSKAEVVLDRLGNEDEVQLDAAKSRNLLLALANVADELAGGRMEDFGGPEIWRRADRALPRLFGSLGAERSLVLKEMFQNGSALGWLTSIFRSETFAHGRHGDRPRSTRLLTADELDLVTGAIMSRYKAMSFAEFAALPQPLSALYAWQQGGDPDGPRNLLMKASETEEGLLHVLETVSGRTQVATPSSARELVTLSRSNVASLLDYDGARSRVEELATSSSADEALRRRARSVAQSFKDGDRF